MPARRIILVLSLIGVALTASLMLRARYAQPNRLRERLAEPLSAAETADLASAMPAIDEIRNYRGSVLAGSLLETLDETGQPPLADKDSVEFVQMLRREARRLDEMAADKEDGNHFDAADALRQQAAGMRETARNVGGGDDIPIHR
jgi:hypothetical protein